MPSSAASAAATIGKLLALAVSHPLELRAVINYKCVDDVHVAPRLKHSRTDSGTIRFIDRKTIQRRADGINRR